MDEHIVYILRSLRDDSFYIGYTTSIILRFAQHQNGDSTHTSKHKPWIVCYMEVFTNKTDALKRERNIKAKKSRSYIEWLIKEMNDALSSR